MNDKVQAALAARQNRLNPSVSGSKTIPAGAGAGNNKVQAALAARETRMRSALPGVLSELQSGLETEIEAFGNAKPVFGNQEETSRNQSASRANIMQLKETVNIWRKYMPEGAADELLATLGLMEQGYDAQVQMASFASQEEWDAVIQYLPKYQGKTSAELKDIADGMSAGKEKDWISQYITSVEYGEKSKYNVATGEIELAQMKKDLSRFSELRTAFFHIVTQKDWSGTREEADALIEEYTQYVAKYFGSERIVDAVKGVQNGGFDPYAELKKLISEKEAYLADAQEIQTYERYMALMGKADFSELSEYVKQPRAERSNTSILMNNYSDEASGWDDPLYEAINGNTEAQAWLQSAGSYGYSSGGSNPLGSLSGQVEAGKTEAQHMTDEEVAVYNYLYKKEGIESAREYYSFLQNALWSRERAADEEYWKKQASESPVMNSLFSVTISPLKGLSAAGQVADYIVDGKVNENASYNRYSHVSSAIREQVASDIAKSGKWGEVGSWTYQLGMSTGDFLVNSAVSGGNSALSLTLMGSGAMADTVITAKDRGLSDDQAMILGLVAGGAEVITEKFSLDALFKGDMTKGAMKYILTNALTEGTEEVGSSLINTFADVLISKDKSEWAKQIAEYMEKNPNATEQKAFQKVLADTALSLGLDFLGGSLMGGAMGTGGATINYAINASPKFEGNKDALAQYGDHIEALIQEGLQSPVESDSYKLAVAYKAKRDSGNAITGYQIRKLVEANENQFRSEDMATIQRATENRLAELGETGNVAAIAEALSKQVAGEKLSGAEQRLVSNSKYGQRVANELNVKNIRSGKYNSMWAENIGTERINAEEYSRLAKTTQEQAQPDGLSLPTLEESVGVNTQDEIENGGINNVSTERETAGPATAQVAGEQAGNGVLYGSSQRNDSPGTGEQTGSLASSTKQQSAERINASRAAVARQNLARSLRLEKVSSIDLGLESGTEAKTVQVIPQEHWDEEMSQLESRIYNETGKHITFVVGRIQAKGTGGGTKYVRGVINGEQIIVQADNFRAPMEQIADHEAYHAKVDFAKQHSLRLNDEIRQHIVSTFSEEQLRTVLNEYIKALRGVIDVTGNMSAAEYENAVQQIEEELFADAYAGINAFGAGADQFTETVNEKMDSLYLGKTKAQDNGTAEPTGPPAEQSTAGADQFSADEDVPGLSLPTLEDVDGETSGQKENTARGGERYSVDEQFERLIDNWDGNTIGFSFVVGETSNALQDAGIPKKQIRWDASKIKTLLEKHNGMTMETVKQIPELLENPIIVIDSKKGSNSKIVMGDLYDEHGNIVTAVILLTPTSKKGNVLDILKISSAEGRSHINSLFAYEDGTPVAVRYVDKNRIQSWLNVNRLQLPLHNLDLDSTNSIDNFGTSVKERFSYDEELSGLSLPMVDDVDSHGHNLTPEQQAFFAQSQARDGDGRLLVLYHQTDADFTIFDVNHPGAGRSDGDTPFGIFLKRSAGDIGLRGKKQMALYANITNPLRAATREELSNKLREISGRYATISDQHKKLDAEYHEKFEQAKNAWRDYLVEWRAANPDASRTAAYDDPKFSELFDAEETVVDEWTAAADRLSVQAKEAITEDLQKAGYDGIFLENDTGSWGRKTDAIIALNPNQVKDVSNKTPSINPDIRYSVDDTAEDDIHGLSLPMLEENSVRNEYIKGDISTETIEADIVKVANMEPVAQITGEEFAKGEKDLVTQVTEFFAELNNRANNPQLGSVVLDRQGVRSDIAHGIGRKKAAAFAAVPDVLARGYVVDYQKNWKGRGYDTAVVAAPILIGSDEYLMGIVLNRNQAENKFYVHEVLTTENGAPPFKTGTRKGNPSGDAPSILSILDRIRNVKANNVGTERYSMDDTAEQQVKSAKKVAKPVAESKPIIAKRDLRNTMLNLFSVPDGQRAELGEVIDGYADRLLKNGSITEEDRKVFFDRMYDAGVMTVPAEEYWSEARSHIAKGRIYVSQRVKQELGDDWNDLRRRAFAAGVYLVNDPSASGIDQWNATLAEQDMLPGLFDAEDTDLRAILERIVQVAEEGRDEQMSLAEYTAMLAQQEYVSEAEILDNMERQMDWALRTFAEKAKLEIHLRDRTGVKIAQEREKGAEKLTMQRVKDAQRRAEERQERREMAQRQRERKELRELQQKTMKQLRWLSKNRYRAPEELQATWDEVLGDIDLYAVSAANEMHWSEKHQATWKDLAQMYKDAQKNDPNFLPSKDLQMIVDRLDATKIADLDIGALQDLYRAAVGLRTEFYNRNNVINDEMHRLFAEVYTDAKQEIEKAPGMFKGTVFDAFMNADQLTPMNMLQRMGGWDPDGVFYSMAKQLEKGERDMRAYTVKAKRMLQTFLEENEDWVRRADGQGKDAVWYELEVPELLELHMGDKPIFGDTVKVWMTPAQKVHMYLESKNVDNLRHMTGGRTFADKELYSQGKRQEAFAQGRTIRLAPETVKKIVSDLTAEEMELARLLDQYYNSFATQEINRVSNILYGYDKAMGKNYAPIYTNRNYTKTEFGVFDVTAEGVGNLKGRQYAVNPSYNIGAFDAFERHVDQTARFCGMAIPARNWTTLMNWRVKNNSTADVITHKWGEEGKKYIEDLITVLQAGEEHKTDTISSGLSKLQSDYISAVFGANPSIVLKQLGSIPLASAYLGVRNVPSVKQIASIDRNLISKYTQDLSWRLMGYSMPETKILKDNPNWTQRNRFYAFTFGGGAITAMDGWAASTLWPWAENKVRKEHPELELGTQAQIDAGESAFYKKVAEEFENAVARSQSTSDEIHQGRLRKSKNPVTRAFTLFRSDSAQTYNAIRQKIGEAQFAIRTGKDDAAIKAAKTTAGAVFGAMLLNAAWSETVSFLMALWKNKGKYYRDDEEELTAQSVMGEMVNNMLGSVAGTVTGGEELFEVIGNIITGEKWYGIDTPGMEQLNDVLETVMDSGKGLRELIAGAADIAENGGDLGAYFAKHKNDILGQIKNLAETAAMYLQGVPVANVEAYLVGAFKWISPEFEAAYDDLWASVGKSNLSGLTGDALAGRLGRILEDRKIRVSEDTIDALSALYEGGETGAVPVDTPGSITIGEETRKLRPYQKQAYETFFSSTVSEVLDDVVESQTFASMDSNGQAKMLSKLYSYGAAKAKAELFDDYKLPSSVAKIDGLKANGLEFADCFGLVAQGADVDDYLELTDNGIDSAQAYDFVIRQEEMEEAAGEDGLKNLDKWRLSVDFFDDVDDQLAALSMVMSDAQMINAEVANDFGVKPDVLVTFYEERVQYDEDGNGSFKQSEIRATIDAEFSHLSNTQKATLWQIFNSSAKNNPYSQAVGQRVLDAKTAMKNN